MLDLWYGALPCFLVFFLLATCTHRTDLLSQGPFVGGHTGLIVLSLLSPALAFLLFSRVCLLFGKYTPSSIPSTSVITLYYYNSKRCKGPNLFGATLGKAGGGGEPQLSRFLPVYRREDRSSSFPSLSPPPLYYCSSRAKFRGNLLLCPLCFRELQ